MTGLVGENVLSSGGSLLGTNLKLKCHLKVLLERVT